MRCEPCRWSSTGPRRGATSRARASCTFVLSALLATVAVVAGSTVSAEAQTDWTGQFSSNWFVSGNWSAGFPRQTTDANIDTVMPNSTEVTSPGALARNLAVGPSGTGMITIQTGGTLANSFGTVGNLPGSQGTVTVTGAGSNWSNAGSVVVGGLGTGTLTIQDSGTVNSGGGSVGKSAGSLGSVSVTGPGSTWINGTSGGLNIGSFGTGTLMIANGGKVINITLFTANIGNGSGSEGTVMVTGAGSTWSNSSGVNIGNLGTGTLTIANGGVVTGPVVIATNAGAIGTLNIGAAAGNPAATPGTLTASSVAFGAGAGTLNFNHTSADYVFAPAISGNGTLNVLAGTTTLTGANSYSGATNVNAGILQAGAPNKFSPHSAVAVAGGGTLDLNGFGQTVSGIINAGLVNLGTGTAPGTVLTTPNYVGLGGTIAMNTFLAGDGSSSDKLVINGGTATGNSFLRITNAGGPGAETVANGIQVVSAINGGTTAPGAFILAGEARAGAFDYDLFRGGLGGSSPSDWFLRSSFIVGPPEPIVPPQPPILPPEPLPEPLPPGVYPIIGPELATYGVVQPIARQMGLQTLGTLQERAGDTLTLANTGGDGAGSFRSEWARFFGQAIDNRYEAFADPHASGWTGGFQGGVDLWRGSFLPGHRDAAGVYLAFANSNVTVSGLVTNAAATGYVQSRTGTLGLSGYSGWRLLDPLWSGWLVSRRRCARHVLHWQRDDPIRVAADQRRGLHLLTRRWLSNSAAAWAALRIGAAGTDHLAAGLIQPGRRWARPGRARHDLWSDRTGRCARVVDDHRREWTGVAALCARQSLEGLGRRGHDNVWDRSSTADRTGDATGVCRRRDCPARARCQPFCPSRLSVWSRWRPHPQRCSGRYWSALRLVMLAGPTASRSVVHATMISRLICPICPAHSSLEFNNIELIQ